MPGLQLRMPSGDWLDMPYVPGSFAVNFGDMLHRWTNGRFKSTPHRALPPVGRDRYAIPFFLGPAFDCPIECLPSCTGPTDLPRWPLITYAGWLAYWYDANYDPRRQKDVAAWFRGPAAGLRTGGVTARRRPSRVRRIVTPPEPRAAGGRH